MDCCHYTGSIHSEECASSIPEKRNDFAMQASNLEKRQKGCNVACPSDPTNEYYCICECNQDDPICWDINQKREATNACPLGSSYPDCNGPCAHEDPMCQDPMKRQPKTEAQHGPVCVDNHEESLESYCLCHQDDPICWLPGK
jgi:hypothetical protein